MLRPAPTFRSNHPTAMLQFVKSENVYAKARLKAGTSLGNANFLASDGQVQVFVRSSRTKKRCNGAF